MADPFDVEKEAEEFCAARGISSDSGKRSTVDLLTRAIDATEEEVEEEIIVEMCFECWDGNKPVFSPADEYRDAAWWHEYPGVGGPCPEPPSGGYCEAHAIHERRRRREEGK